MRSGATFPPTARRLAKARTDGDVPVSAALIGAGALAGALVAAPTALARLVTSESAALLEALSARSTAWDAARGATWDATLAGRLAARIMEPAWPLLLGAALGALAAGLVGVGGRIAVPRRPPADGGLWGNLLRTSLAFGLVGTAALVVLATDLDALTRDLTGAGDMLSRVGGVAARLGWTGLGALATLAALDLLVARAAWRRRLFMTWEERRVETRETEGDPDLRRERQRRRREHV